MASLSVNHIRIVGLAASVPINSEENIDLPIFENREDALKVIRSTGIERRRVVCPGTTASDLAVPAVRKILSELEWTTDSVDCFIYVSSTRDYISPQTSCILQSRLGLSESCFVLDLPLGCSGWVHGLSVITSLVSHGGLKRGLLVNAETNSLNRSSKDRTVKPLFGDAAAVTAVEFTPDKEKPFNFVFGVDGTGAEAVMMKYGGTRYPVTHESLEETVIAPGIVRRGIDMVINGMDVFAFAIKRPPASLKELISTFHIDIDQIDYLYLHQANRYIEEKIRKSIKIPAEKVPYSLTNFGNTTDVSIPLTMVTETRDALRTGKRHCLACGFGVGLAWASTEFEIDQIVCPPLIEL